MMEENGMENGQIPSPEEFATPFDTERKRSPFTRLLSLVLIAVFLFAAARTGGSFIAQAVRAFYPLRVTVPSHFIVAEGTENYVINETVETYEKVPAGIREELENDGWVIRLGPDVAIENYSLTEKDLPDGIVIYGNASFSDRVITLRNSSDYAIESIAHEVGHYVDISLGAKNIGVKYSDTDEFRDLYNKETSAFPADAIVSDAGEYFAEAFDEYCVRPSSLRKHCPETYVYFDALLKDYA
ncbi:MAG: hypothetical protein J5935_06520 [Lachnospiraceae bacterium]|nr:hypothetical protein [Lachnospiraceae bacterium]